MQPLTIFIAHPSDLITDHLPNGDGWIAYNFLKGLTERGHTVHVAAPRIELHGSLPPRMHLYLVPKRSGAFGRLNYIQMVRKLFIKLNASINFDLVQQLNPVETGLSLGVLGTNIPLVLGPYPAYWPSDASGPSQRTSFKVKLKNLIRDSFASFQQRQASALIVTCPAAIERVVWRSARETLVRVVSSGIDSRAYPERERIPAKPSILFLANLEYRKGIFTLLEAFDRVAERIPDCSLDIWGDGAETEAVGRRVCQSPFRDRIFRRGRASRDKVCEIMRSHSVYCVPSYGEPFGTTLLEALASGVPIVTTNAGGSPYIVQEAGGRIVPTRDAERLADALIEILSSVELQESMGTYNRKRVEQEFSWGKAIDRLENVYEWVLSKKASPSAAEVSNTL